MIYYFRVRGKKGGSTDRRLAKLKCCQPRKSFKKYVLGAPARTRHALSKQQKPTGKNIIWPLIENHTLTRKKDPTSFQFSELPPEIRQQRRLERKGTVRPCPLLSPLLRTCRESRQQCLEAYGIASTTTEKEPIQYNWDVLYLKSLDFSGRCFLRPDQGMIKRWGPIDDIDDDISDGCVINGTGDPIISKAPHSSDQSRNSHRDTWWLWMRP